MTLLEKIDMILERKGLKQHQLERLAGLASKRLSKWANGTGKPNAQQAVAIARVLGVPVSWLVDDDAPDEPESPAVYLTEAERIVLEAARDLGYLEAMRRLRRPAKEKAPSPDQPPDRGTELPYTWTDEDQVRTEVKPPATPPKKTPKKA